MLSFSPANETTYVCSGVVRSGKVSGTKVFDMLRKSCAAGSAGMLSRFAVAVGGGNESTSTSMER
jgi:hypothetical protein